jgi:hypothetical protein
VAQAFGIVHIIVTGVIADIDRHGR